MSILLTTVNDVVTKVF